MSISIIIFYQNFNANYVDIMVFEPSVLFPPPQFFFGGGELNTWSEKFPIRIISGKQIELFFSPQNAVNDCTIKNAKDK